jgi:hypothetical protein
LDLNDITWNAITTVRAIMKDINKDEENLNESLFSWLRRKIANWKKKIILMNKTIQKKIITVIKLKEEVKEAKRRKRFKRKRSNIRKEKERKKLIELLNSNAYEEKFKCV